MKLSSVFLRPLDRLLHSRGESWGNHVFPRRHSFQPYQGIGKALAQKENPGQKLFMAAGIALGVLGLTPPQEPSPSPSATLAPTT